MKRVAHIRFLLTAIWLSKASLWPAKVLAYINRLSRHLLVNSNDGQNTVEVDCDCNFSSVLIYSSGLVRGKNEIELSALNGNPIFISFTKFLTTNRTVKLGQTGIYGKRKPPKKALGEIKALDHESLALVRDKTGELTRSILSDIIWRRVM
jgi:hypothetical protein